MVRITQCLLHCTFGHFIHPGVKRWFERIEFTVQIDSCRAFAGSTVDFLRTSKPPIVGKAGAASVFEAGVRCSLFKSSSVLYPRTMVAIIRARFFIACSTHCFIFSAHRLLCRRPSRRAEHTGENSDKVVYHFISRLTLKNHLNMASLRL